jgi:hypothetical protein
VREVDAGQGAGAKVVCALCCEETLASELGTRAWSRMLLECEDCGKSMVLERVLRRTSFILRLVPFTVAPDVLLLLLLLVSLLAEHLVEEAELRLCGEDEGAQDHEERG